MERDIVDQYGRVRIFIAVRDNIIRVSLFNMNTPSEMNSTAESVILELKDHKTRADLYRHLGEAVEGILTSEKFPKYDDIYEKITGSDKYKDECREVKFICYKHISSMYTLLKEIRKFKNKIKKKYSTNIDLKVEFSD